MFKFNLLLKKDIISKLIHSLRYPRSSILRQVSAYKGLLYLLDGTLERWEDGIHPIFFNNQNN